VYLCCCFSPGSDYADIGCRQAGDQCSLGRIVAGGCTLVCFFPEHRLGIIRKRYFVTIGRWQSESCRRFQSVVPQPEPTLTALVIAAGDASYQRVCPSAAHQKSFERRANAGLQNQFTIVGRRVAKLRGLLPNFYIPRLANSGPRRCLRIRYFADFVKIERLRGF